MAVCLLVAGQGLARVVACLGPESQVKSMARGGWIGVLCVLELGVAALAAEGIRNGWCGVWGVARRRVVACKSAWRLRFGHYELMSET